MYSLVQERMSKDVYWLAGYWLNGQMLLFFLLSTPQEESMTGWSFLSSPEVL